MVSTHESEATVQSCLNTRYLNFSLTIRNSNMFLNERTRGSCVALAASRIYFYNKALDI